MIDILPENQLLDMPWDAYGRLRGYGPGTLQEHLDVSDETEWSIQTQLTLKRTTSPAALQEAKHKSNFRRGQKSNIEESEGLQKLSPELQEGTFMEHPKRMPVASYTPLE
ncbi:hypothetical protein K402DRAFT_117278 [Aulographum hederae CBS 113979]|uniref:Uncharacterized protein n=1 Tax=Aulographum hederae CBS 113979 TaxID=1176131 RepID=A0A6G1GVS8_9PEZI|nr:hypothetical protein K402DRAFT_117278 [Aulographum hederae CBS 113979]